jgi:hypothetical protein
MVTIRKQSPAQKINLSAPQQAWKIQTKTSLKLVSSLFHVRHEFVTLFVLIWSPPLGRILAD